jgi:hypothetical protein
MASRSGPKPLYNPDEGTWLRSALDEYMGVVADNPRNLAKQRKFRDEKVEEFLDEFRDQLLDECRTLETPPVTDIKQWRDVSGLESPFASLADSHMR